MKRSINTGESFWAKPQGTAGAVILMTVVVVVVIFIRPILGWMVDIVHDALKLTLYSILLAGLISILVFIKKSRIFTIYVFQKVSEFFANIFTDIDPIGILKALLRALIIRFKKFADGVKKMKVSLGYLHQSIIKNNKEIADVIGEIRKHMENGEKDMVLMYAEHVGMLKQNNEELVATYHKMTEQYKKMIQISDAGKVAIKQAELKVSALEKHHAILTDSYNAMESAMSLIAGTPNPLARFYQTSDRVVRTMGEKMKDIEYFMLKSDEFVDDMDLQKGKYRKDGLELLENLANERLTDVFSTPVPSLPEEGVNLELTKEDENFFAEVEKLLKVKQTVEVPEAVE